MARNRHSDDTVLKLLREIEPKLANGGDVRTARRAIGIGDAAYSNWRRQSGGVGSAKLSKFRDLERERENIRPERNVPLERHRPLRAD
ncbi:MAG: transposase [Rhodobacteraceae bacterium]|nr:transposase [Paracoccaceae bacterium]